MYFVVLFALLLTFTLFNKYITDNFLLESIIEHAFEGICNLFNDGKFTTSSSEKMFDAYICLIIFGHGLLAMLNLKE